MTATPTRSTSRVQQTMPARPATPDQRGPAIWMWIALTGFVFGTVSLPWDVANHIENIRDAVLYPAHLGLLTGLAIWAIGGALSVITRPDDVPLRARRGGLLTAIGATTAFCSFPLDALWHELFGIDVTLWGPTHLVMMLGGTIASFGVFTMCVDQARGRGRLAKFGANCAAAIPTATILSFLLEYAFDVPQFSLLYPTLISAVAVGLGLVTARLLFGRGAAIIANLAFLALSVGFVDTYLAAMGYNTTHVRLMLPAAIAVEIAFLIAPRRHAVWLAGVFVGTFGTLGEWAWNAWTIDDYPSEVLTGSPWVWPAAALVGVIAAQLGAWIASALQQPATPATAPKPPRASRQIAGLAALVAVLAAPMLIAGDSPLDVTVTPDAPDAARTTFTFTIDDGAMRDVHAADVVSNHGGDLITRKLERVAPDTWRTTEPSPISGSWFTSLRLMRTNEIQGIALRAPGGSIYGDAVDLQSGELRTQAVEPVPTAGRSPLIPIGGYVVLALLGVAALVFARWALMPERSRAHV